MSQYDLIGDDWDDDDMGGIGAELEDLIAGDDDDALMELLSVSGAGDTEIVGAKKKRAVKKALLKKIMGRDAAAVVKTGLRYRRRYPLGFVRTTVASATTSLIPANPQNLFRPERLIIPSNIAFDFGVRDVKVGNQSQLVQSVEVPAAVFSEVAIDSQVTFDTAEVGNQIAVDVVNNSAGSLAFTAGFLGTIAK